MLTSVHTENVLGLDFSCLHDGFLCLFVVLFGDDFELFSGFLKYCLFGLEFVGGSVEFICKLFVLFGDFIVTAGDFIESGFKDVDFYLLTFDQFTVFVLLCLE